jgi:hypothetical protein
MRILKDWSNFYYGLGFNITSINPLKNDSKTKKIFKAPTTDRQTLKNRRQTISEIKNLEWSGCSGIGTVLGFGRLRCIDIDFKSDMKISGESQNLDMFPLVSEILTILNLPSDYKWVVQTPSKGFHVIFYSDNHDFITVINPVSKQKESKTKAIKPNQHTLSKYPWFGHFELRWNYHLVLPPSIGENGNYYSFRFGIPNEIPSNISIDKINSMIRIFCLDEYQGNKGFNLRLEDYHLNHQYIDYNPVLF